VSYVSRRRMACIGVACAITYTAFAAGTLDHVRQNSSAQSASATHPATKFVLGDLKIEGDVHDRDGVRDRILNAWKGREYDDVKELAYAVMEVGIRGDFQERGYFKVVAHDPVSQPLGLIDGKQRILVIASITEGDQFHLGAFTIQNVAPDRALSFPAATLREQFHLRDGDFFQSDRNPGGTGEIEAVIWAHGFADAKAEPDTELDSASHRIALILRITEGRHTP
jgi:hypothetical protein